MIHLLDRAIGYGIDFLAELGPIFAFCCFWWSVQMAGEVAAGFREAPK